MASYHWQSQKIRQVGVDDLVLLTKINEAAIVEMLKKRYLNGLIFTYIGPVLISVNPFKQMNYFTDKEIEIYQGAAQYENPPHIYALADDMYRNMLIDVENHCAIISGESGAGKTVCAKYIMNYVTKISGGGQRVKRVKEIILGSNPLLEAFGNAKTIRNNNSSRFGKYCEILFGSSGEPVGGKISNFLLEKSRVSIRSNRERNFHIFYQLCYGSPLEVKEKLGLTDPDYYFYLNQSDCYTIDGIDDVAGFQETLTSMETVGLSEEIQLEVLKLIAGILHIGNINFEERNNYAVVSQDDFLQFPAYLFGLDAKKIESKITSRRMDTKWGKNNDESIDVSLTCDQAAYTRDAWAKSLYARLFDFLVEAVNTSMQAAGRQAKSNERLLTLGVLDIYGFEIFQHNSFEQFCINYVNEKLQQIFIELTLKAEQEEYLQEGVAWTQIDYFNNKIVCDLIEGRTPPGIFCILDDVCTQIHGQSDGVDDNFLNKLDKMVRTHEHYQKTATGFLIHHYAGQVSYDIDGFCDKNRDVLFPDIIQLMQSSNNKFIVSLFPENVISGAKTRPTTVGSKIKSQANMLVESLTKCTPHYIRCIKPNETKRALEWEDDRVKHQVEYLGLKENIRVRRAGYAYRRPFDKFMHRYAIILPKSQRKMESKNGVEKIAKSVCIDRDQYQLGKTKVFIKNPESLFLLEETRERKFDHYARILQKAFTVFNARKRDDILRKEASDLLFNRKERNRFSLNRKFFGDYINLDEKPAIRAIVGKRERIEFAYSVTKYDRRFKMAKRDLIVTSKAIFLIGREMIRQGPDKNKIVDVLKRKIDFKNLEKIASSTKQDDFIIIYVKNDYANLIQCPLKTELLTKLSKKYQEKCGQLLTLDFSDCLEYLVKKDIWSGSGIRCVKFFSDAPSSLPMLKVYGKELHISVASGLPKNARPGDLQALNHHHTNGSTMNKGLTVTQNLKSRGPSADAIVKNLIRRISKTSFDETSPLPNHLPCAQAIAGAQRRLITGKEANGFQTDDTHILSTPNAGKAGETRRRLNMERPVPGAGRPKPRPPAPSKPPKPCCRTLYAYDAQATDELSFEAGQILEILSEDSSGWWLGRLNKLEGLFPSNYVEKLNSSHN